MGKAKGSFDFLNLEKSLSEFLKEVGTETREARESGLDKASDFLVDKLSAATPTETGETAKSWKRTDKYQGVRYISNTRLNANQQPVVNFLEFGKKGNPFVRKTFEQNKNQIENIILEEIKK